MITSAVGGEGKTSLASYLATSLAQSGLRTLLIDADLRSPMMHRLFDRPPAPGLSELLRGEVGSRRRDRDDGRPDLMLLPAGRCDRQALRLLSQGGIGPLFDQLKQRFDFIIVDTSPILPVADGMLIAQHVDAAIFSIFRDVSRKPKVKAAFERLQRLGVPVLGAVVTGAGDGSYGNAYSHSDSPYPAATGVGGRSFQPVELITMNILRITAAVALIVGVGLVHGTWTNRWGPTPELAELASRFDSVPMAIGDWSATPSQLGERERKLAGAEACLARVYTNATRGLSVSVLLLGGLPGDIAAHTPEVCYIGAGYDWTTAIGSTTARAPTALARSSSTALADSARGQSVRPADLLELARRDGVGRTRGAPLALRVRADPLQALHRPRDRRGGRRSRSRPLQRFPRCLPARARSGGVPRGRRAPRGTAIIRRSAGPLRRAGLESHRDECISDGCCHPGRCLRTADPRRRGRPEQRGRR